MSALRPDDRLVIPLAPFPPEQTPRYLDEAASQAANDDLVRVLHKEQPAQLRRILDKYEGQIDHTFVGFVEQYRALAQLLPLDTTVVDLGCANAPQAWYFRRHAGYIGVDVSTPLVYRFAFGNTRHVKAEIREWIASGEPQKVPRPTFAVCQYVPGITARMVCEAFGNVFCYYP